MRLAPLLLGASVFAAYAADPAVPGPADPRIRSVTYSPDAVIAVPVKRGVPTHIVLADDEKIIEHPVPGRGSDCAKEDHQWCIVSGERDIFVKPRAGAERKTNTLAVVTTQRRYSFDLLALPEASTALPVIRLSIVIPQPPAPALAAVLNSEPRRLSAKELIENRMRAEPQVRNADYSVAVGEGAEDIVPSMVFDNGSHTFFNFPGNRPVPAVFQTAADGQREERINSHMEGDRLVVDRVSRRFVLRLGESVVAVINEAFDIEGAPPVEGTTIPGVVRVLRTQQQVGDR